MRIHQRRNKTYYFGIVVLSLVLLLCSCVRSQNNAGVKLNSLRKRNDVDVDADAVRKARRGYAAHIQTTTNETGTEIGRSGDSRVAHAKFRYSYQQRKYLGGQVLRSLV